MLGMTFPSDSALYPIENTERCAKSAQQVTGSFRLQVRKKTRACTLDPSTFLSLATCGEIALVENPFGTATTKVLHS